MNENGSDCGVIAEKALRKLKHPISLVLCFKMFFLGISFSAQAHFQSNINLSISR